MKESKKVISLKIRTTVGSVLERAKERGLQETEHVLFPVLGNGITCSLLTNF